MPPLPPSCRAALAAVLPAVRLPWPEASPLAEVPLGVLLPQGITDPPLTRPVAQDGGAPGGLADWGGGLANYFTALLGEDVDSTFALKIVMCLLSLSVLACVYLHRQTKQHDLLAEATLKTARGYARNKMMTDTRKEMTTDTKGSQNPGGEVSTPGSQLPAVCPQFLRASAGARITVPSVPRDAATWSSDLAVEALCPDQRVDRNLGAPAPVLSVALRWAPREDHLARVVEIEEASPRGGKTVIASVSTDLEVRLTNDLVFGRLRYMGRRRYVLEAASDGEPLMCVSTSAEATSLELGALPEGLLLATAAQSRAGDSMEVLARPGVDVAFALVCVLAIKLFAPPAAYDPVQR